MAAFKDKISPELVAALAGEMSRAWPDFPRRRFVARATDGLGQLELLARVEHVALALGECLPEPFTEGAAVVERALESEGLTGWMTLACNGYVATHGIDE